MSTSTDLRGMIREELQKLLQSGGQSGQQPQSSGQAGSDQSGMLQQLAASVGQSGQQQASGQTGPDPSSSGQPPSGQGGILQQLVASMRGNGQQQPSGQSGSGQDAGQDAMLQEILKSLGQSGQSGGSGGSGSTQPSNPLQQLMGPFQGQAALLLPVGGQAAGSSQGSTEQLASDLRQQLQKLKAVIAETQAIAKRIESVLQEQPQPPGQSGKNGQSINNQTR